jgi:hypothetical protein
MAAGVAGPCELSRFNRNQRVAYTSLRQLSLASVDLPVSDLLASWIVKGRD